MAADASAAKEANDHGDSNTKMGSKEQFAIDGMELIFEGCFPSQLFPFWYFFPLGDLWNQAAKCSMFK